MIIYTDWHICALPIGNVQQIKINFKNCEFLQLNRNNLDFLYPVNVLVIHLKDICRDLGVCVDSHLFFRRHRLKTYTKNILKQSNSNNKTIQTYTFSCNFIVRYAMKWKPLKIWIVFTTVKFLRDVQFSFALEII